MRGAEAALPGRSAFASGGEAELMGEFKRRYEVCKTEIRANNDCQII
ncbi:MAG: hypothetical protein METHAR1v1_1440009 [Methanothrix sp.]|nr:MAG: hypothetical protein METHAR1v1_1440009 [Methanothrix sp.]